jgi:hypothetical protein
MAKQIEELKSKIDKEVGVKKWWKDNLVLKI